MCNKVSRVSIGFARDTPSGPRVYSLSLGFIRALLEVVGFIRVRLGSLRRA